MLNILLATKLYFPPVHPRLVPRPRLIERLQQGLSGPLTLLCAPAGAGKTTLLSEWRAGPGATWPAAWLSLSADDNDLKRFLLYLVAALDSLQPGLANEIYPLLQASDQPNAVTALTIAINHLNELEGKALLALDDYHLIELPAIHEALAFLLENLPPHLHLVLLTRTDPPLPLPRLRARGQLTEIRIPGLRFQPAEAHRFLNEVMDLGLSATDVESLYTRTEGWIAGLKLAAISLQQQADRHAFVAAFAGDDRYVMDYLLEEVLCCQLPAIQSFLIRTSFLERLTSALCQAVTGQTDSQAILDGLETANLFVSSLDNRRHWYRYHSLFADLLRHRLRQTLPPDERQELVRRACAWYEGQGLPVEAISQALACAEYPLAVQLLERHALAVFFRSETLLVHRWLTALPEAILRQSPLLCAIYANTSTHVAVFKVETLQETERWLAAAEAALAVPGPTRPHDFRTRCFIGMSRAYLSLWRKDTPQTTIDLAHRALADLPAEGTVPADSDFLRMRSALTNNLGISYMLLGNEPAALHAYQETQRIGAACGDLLNLYSAVVYQCELLILHGHLPEAMTLCQETLGGYDPVAERAAARVVERPTKPMPYAAAVYLTAGLIWLEWNELAKAEAAIARCQELSAWMAAVNWQMESIIARARLELARGRLTEAFALLDQVRPGTTPVNAAVPAWRARLYLADSYAHPGALQEAIHWAVGQSLQPIRPFISSLPTLTLARVQIAQYRQAVQDHLPKRPDLKPLQDFLDEQIANAQAAERPSLVAELYLLQALAWQAQNHPAEAQQVLLRSLENALPGGLVRLYLAEGLPARHLLGRLKPDDPRLADYLRRILVSGATAEPGLATPASASAPTAGSAPDLVEPLTERELEVLGWLVTGATNAEIARRLVISLDTVKRHVTHIYAKLAVPDRAAAIQRAYDLGLVQHAG